MFEQNNVGALRQQSAFLPAETPIFVKIGDKFYRVARSWPDTSMGPCGNGLYLEVIIKI
jgi:hypothetical protein